MKIKPSILLNVVLGASLLGVCTYTILQSSSKQDDNEDVVYNNIMTRTSIRSYDNKVIEDEKIDKLLHAGMAAPSAMNRQPWHFVVIKDKQILQQIAQLTPNSGMAKDAPLAIVTCGDMSKYKDDETKLRDFWVQDLSAASENILLQAHAMGLGAVWTGLYPSEERSNTIAKLLNLPQNLVPLNTIVIGYPKEDQQPKDKWNPENISYK